VSTIVSSCDHASERASDHSGYSFVRDSGRLLLFYPTHVSQCLRDRGRVSTCRRASLVNSSYVILLIIEESQQTSPRSCGDRVVSSERAVSSYHVVNSTEQSPAILPLARNHGIVLCFVSCAVFLAREAALRRLRAPVVPTEQRFRVSFVVLS